MHPTDKKEVLVINYHQLVKDDEALPANAEHIYTVKKSDFEQHLFLLAKHKIPLVSIKDIHTNNCPAGFSVALSFDDGNASDLSIALPLLKSHGMTATFFWLSEKTQLWPEVAQFNQLGFSIQSHGINHRAMNTLSAKEQQEELMDSKKNIEHRTGMATEGFAFPFGIYNKHLIKQTQLAGYAFACSTDVKLNYPENKPFLIHRWSVKRTTSLAYFEGMITKSGVLNKAIKMSLIKKTVMSFLGQKLSHQINSLLNRY